MPEVFDRCVRKVKAKGKVSNAWAVCRGSLGTDKRIKARRKKKKVRHRGKEFKMRG
jgi:hypothetical protein